MPRAAGGGGEEEGEGPAAAAATGREPAEELPWVRREKEREMQENEPQEGLPFWACLILSVLSGITGVRPAPLHPTPRPTHPPTHPLRRRTAPKPNPGDLPGERGGAGEPCLSAASSRQPLPPCPPACAGD